MIRPLLHALYLVEAVASFTNCASYPQKLAVSDLYADPIGIVANNHPLSFRVTFTVPNETWIPHGSVQGNTTWNSLYTTTVRAPLSNYIPTPIYPGLYTFSENYTFPSNVWGRISSEVNVYNASGTQLLCTRWIVFATGRDTNETGWPWSSLYAE